MANWPFGGVTFVMRGRAQPPRREAWSKVRGRVPSHHQTDAPDASLARARDLKAKARETRFRPLKRRRCAGAAGTQWKEHGARWDGGARTDPHAAKLSVDPGAQLTSHTSPKAGSACAEAVFATRATRVSAAVPKKALGPLMAIPFLRSDRCEMQTVPRLRMYARAAPRPFSASGLRRGPADRRRKTRTDRRGRKP
jgi:hypothetical protein